MSDAIEMPPFHIAAAALRKTTEQLATWIEQPPKSPPDWSELEWAVARAAATMQGISSLLATRLPWAGPTDWRSFLHEQHNQCVLREEKIDSLLTRIDEATRRAGITCVALKGAALRKLDLYDAGARPMGDVDLLLRSTDLDQVDATLGDLDYIEAASTDRHIAYAPRSSSGIQSFGENAENPIPIDVHTTVTEPLPVSKLDITDAIEPALDHPGLQAYPNRGALMLHLLLHAAGSMKANALRQIQLHDIAILGRRLSDTDWQRVFHATSESSRWWVFPPLALTNRYFSDCVPENVLTHARTICPTVLRHSSDRYSLTDVSWSNLRISAFPGIAFSRTPLEALRLVRSRLVPSRRALSDLDDIVERRPHLNSLPWYRLPHGARILRWAFSRPPRVQTMVSLRASLDNRGMSVD